LLGWRAAHDPIHEPAQAQWQRCNPVDAPSRAKPNVVYALCEQLALRGAWCEYAKASIGRRNGGDIYPALREL